jgi:hypothetical protein
MAAVLDEALYLEGVRDGALAFEELGLLGAVVEALDTSVFLVLACGVCSVAGWKFSILKLDLKKTEFCNFLYRFLGLAGILEMKLKFIKLRATFCNYQTSEPNIKHSESTGHQHHFY